MGTKLKIGRRTSKALEAPSYFTWEVAQYLGVPTSTIRAWTRGQNYLTKGGIRKVFKPIIEIPETQPPMLSFVNLLEAHVASAFRRHLSFAELRRSLEFLRTKYGARHPLLEYELLINKSGLIVRENGRLVSATQEGQLESEELIRSYLMRIDRDAHGLPVRLYPFTRKNDLDAPRTVAISPYVAFGRPVLVGTGIPVAEIVGRHKAGESLRELAKDYERSPEEIEEALRFCEAA